MFPHRTLPSIVRGPIDLVFVFGTRPEAIKLAPVISLLSTDPAFAVRVVTTGQHREMVREIIEPLGIRCDTDLDIMRPGQSLNDIVSAVVSRIDSLLVAHRPDAVLVQGDTSTAFAAALAAFHRRIAVGHIEAGLRSHNRSLPFPEETNRRMISVLADIHFAPTGHAARNLANEGVSAERILTTGNTVIDALSLVLGKQPADAKPICEGKGFVLITLHRREAWDGSAADGSNVLANILKAIGKAAMEHPQFLFLYPMHRNPRVRDLAKEILGTICNVRLVDPLGYFEFVQTMAHARLIVTDSGGIQEEAPSLGVPVLVLRDTTERPEALKTGWNQLVGTDPAKIHSAISAELGIERTRPPEVKCQASPFGDGRASERIRDALLWLAGRADVRPADFSAEGC